MHPSFPRPQLILKYGAPGASDREPLEINECLRIAGLEADVATGSDDCLDNAAATASFHSCGAVVDIPSSQYVSSTTPSNGQATQDATTSTTTNMNNNAGDESSISTTKPIHHTSHCQQQGDRLFVRPDPPISVASEQSATRPKRRRLHAGAPTFDFSTQQTNRAKRKPEDAMSIRGGPTNSQSHPVITLRTKKPRVDTASTAAAQGELLIGPRLSARFKPP